MFKTKPTQILLGVFTILPLIYMIYFFYTVSSSMSAPATSFDQESFDQLFKIHFASMLLTLVLLIVYITHLFRNKVVPNDKKALWAVILFLGNVIAMIVYWFLYIWTSSSKSLDSHDL
jgi:glucan phosphoethanolaminetransferase (alkaline phosphatase superfamily)